MSMLGTVRSQKLLSFTVLLFTLSLGILIGTLLRTGVSAQGQGAPDATPLSVPSAVQLSNEFTQLAKKLEPSVVNITVDYNLRQQTSRNRKQQTPPPGQEDQFDLFRRFFGSPFEFEAPAPRRSSGTGSGVVVDPNGYILTNNHVVDQADRIKVKLTGDSTEYVAKLIGTDRETDLAVIKIDAPRKLSAAKIGNSDAVQVGDWAVAIGSPFGLETSVTAGIISAKERDFPGQQYQHFLQTDAAINPGNSGGPLLNIRGEVIGVNTAIATSSNGYQGIGFALPINSAVQVYNQIIKSGRVTRGSIGVSLQTEGAGEVVKAYTGGTEGAFVTNVTDGSPAEKAGLKEQDVIVSFNGKPLASGDALVNAVSEAPVGSQATLGVIRDRKKIEVRVTVADRTEVYADNPLIAGRRPDRPGQPESAGMRFGFSVEGLTSADRSAAGLDGKVGVRIVSVEPASFADDIGLQPDDVLSEINGQTITSADDIRRVQATLKPGDSAAFRVLRSNGVTTRGGRPQWVAVYVAGTLPSQF